MPKRTTLNIKTDVKRRPVSPLRYHCQVKHEPRDIDPRPIDKIIVKFVFFSFVCSRCQVGFKGHRAMGACITNKYILWHALLSHKKLYKSFFATQTLTSYVITIQTAKDVAIIYILNISFMTSGTGTRDIDPRSSPYTPDYIKFWHTMLPVNEYLFPNHSATLRFMHTPRTSNRTLNGEFND